jgi:pyruvate dehydrogenase E2 component (dihydrolipoamide acetyltransferase)
MDDIDVSKLWEVRNAEKKHFEIEGVKLTFLPFIIKACISALKENPILNSAIEAEEILIRKYFNVGVAVETEIGLMVPVIKIAEKKSVAQIAKEIVDLAEKARTRKIDIMDMQGSTFTITNYGSVGGTYATPILNVGNAAILGVGRIYDRAVLGKDGKVVNRKILPVSLTFDHRILDGAQASRFLESLKMFLGDPEELFGSGEK